MPSLTRRRTTTNSASWFPIAVVALFAVGCVADARRRIPAPAPKTKLRSLSFQVDPESALYEPAQRAAATWSQATGATVLVSPDGDIPIFFVDTLDINCTQGRPSRACSHVTEDPRDSWTEIPSSQHPSVYYRVILHEMGHHLALRDGHVEGVPDALMAPNSSISIDTLRPEDIAFICTGNRIECPAFATS